MPSELTGKPGIVFPSSMRSSVVKPYSSGGKFFKSIFVVKEYRVDEKSRWRKGPELMGLPGSITSAGQPKPFFHCKFSTWSDKRKCSTIELVIPSIGARSSVKTIVGGGFPANRHTWQPSLPGAKDGWIVIGRGEDNYQ